MSTAESDAAIEAAKLALFCIPRGPTLAEFGIAREDCALAHIDYFGSVGAAIHVLCEAIAQAEGISAAEATERYAQPVSPCDCRSCVSPDAHSRASARHRAAYTNVLAWVPSDGAPLSAQTLPA